MRTSGPPMSEPYPFKMLGRMQTAEDGLLLENVLSGVEINFEGTLFGLHAVGETAKLKILSESGPREVLVNGSADIALTLPAGRHTVSLLKASSPRYGAVKLGGLFTDGAFLPPNGRAKRRILFVGDSITAGCGAAGTCDQPLQTLENSDATLAFAHLTASRLGADCAAVALESVCIRDSSPCAYDFFLRIAPENPTPCCDFDFDTVVLALGENDMWHAASPDFPNYDILKFKADYADMVRLIHVKCPSADIVCLYGMMPASSTAEAERAIAAAVEKSGVRGVVRLRADSDERGGNFHPCAAAHRATADLLCRRLTQPENSQKEGIQ